MLKNRLGELVANDKSKLEKLINHFETLLNNTPTSRPGETIIKYRTVKYIENLTKREIDYIMMRLNNNEIRKIAKM